MAVRTVFRASLEKEMADNGPGRLDAVSLKHEEQIPDDFTFLSVLFLILSQSITIEGPPGQLGVDGNSEDRPSDGDIFLFPGQKCQGLAGQCSPASASI